MTTKKDEAKEDNLEYIRPLLKDEVFRSRYSAKLFMMHQNLNLTNAIKTEIFLINTCIREFSLIVNTTSRDELRKTNPHMYNRIMDLFKKYSEAKKAIKTHILKNTDEKPKVVMRSDLNLSAVVDTTKIKKMIITCVYPQAGVDEDGFGAIKTWCEHNGGDYFLLAMRGTKKDKGYTPEELQMYSTHLATEIRINSNLVAKDFQLLPQMIIPTTGLKRFGQKNYSVIVASPKQFMTSVARGKGKHPHIVYTTGTISLPDYNYDRQGQIANQDHTYGGLIIELIDDNYFYIRNFTIDECGGFNDLNKYYTTGVVAEEAAEAVSLGDSHYGMEDIISEQGSKDLVKLTKPKYVVFNDICDNRSITHHERHKIIARYRRSETQKTLLNELNHLAQKMKEWINAYPDCEFVVIPSNHDDFIEEWLNSGTFAFDDTNARVGAELFIAMLDGVNPIKWFLAKYHGITQLKFLDRDDSFSLSSCELNTHGDKGANGAKGSVGSLEISYGKCTAAHAHTPQIYRDVYVVGTNCIPNPSYTKGSTSSWLSADVVQYKNGSRQMIIKINGKFTTAQL